MINQEHFLEGFLKCLVKQDILHLPGFGVFSCSYKSATIDVMGGKISPPSKEITFSSGDTINQESIKLVANELGVSFEEMQEFYRNLCANWNNKLAQKEIIQLNGLGRIYKEFNGEIKFKQELNSDIFKDDELPILDFRPLRRSLRSKAAIESVKSSRQKVSYNTQRKKKNLFSLLTTSELLPITIGIASFLLILGSYLIIPRQPDFTNQSLAEKVKVERINQKPSHKIEAELAKDTFMDIVKAEQDLEDEVSAVFETEKMAQADSIEEIPETKRISPKKLHQVIIITGAYQNINGAKRKIKSLIAKGYNPYQDVKADLHRVGITFSYREAAELQENLLQIRETISPQAWILD